MKDKYPERGTSPPDKLNGGRKDKKAKHLDQDLIRDLRKLYQPVLDEPVPNEFLEILKRRRQR